MKFLILLYRFKNLTFNRGTQYQLSFHQFVYYFKLNINYQFYSSIKSSVKLKMIKSLKVAILIFAILYLSESQIEVYPPSPFTTCGYPGRFKLDEYFFSSNITKILPFSENFQNPLQAVPKDKVCRPDGHCMFYYDIDITDKNISTFSKTFPNQCITTNSTYSNGTWILSYGSGRIQGLTITVPEGHESLVRFNNKVSQRFFQTFSTCTSAGKTGRPFSVHTHGQSALSQFDGLPEATFCRDQSATYLYPNNIAKTGFYRDAAHRLTAENNFYGAAGAYIVSAKKKHGGCGEPFDLENVEEKIMMLKDTVIDHRCELDIFIFQDAGVPRSRSTTVPFLTRQQIQMAEGDTYPTGEQIQRKGQVPHRQQSHNDFLYGDINLVNGIPFPRMEVQAKLYRFRFINAANERPYLISIRDFNNIEYSTKICRIVAADGGFLKQHIQFPADGLLIAVGERYEIVCDFRTVAGKQLYFYNNRNLKITVDVPMFCFSHLISKIIVSKSVPLIASIPNLSSMMTNQARKDLLNSEIVSTTSATVGTTLNYITSILLSPLIKISSTSPDQPFKITELEYNNFKLMAQREQYHRRFDFEYRKDRWKINQFLYEQQKIGANNIVQNSWQVWYVRGGIGIIHSLHLSMVNFLVLHRTDDGNNILKNYESVSPKDTVYMGPNNHIFLLVKMGPHSGDFIFNCMNHIHQDISQKQIMRITSANPTPFINIPNVLNSIELSKILNANYYKNFYGSLNGFCKII